MSVIQAIPEPRTFFDSGRGLIEAPGSFRRRGILRRDPLGDLWFGGLHETWHLGRLSRTSQ